MPLKIAVQMDPIESVNIKGDSSFALMLAAQERGHEVFEYHVESLTLDADDRLYAQGFPVTVRKVEGDHFVKGEAVRLDLGKDIDVILMRQDPPFHMGYITATHLLERIAGETLVVNDPASVRNAPEKVMVLDYRRFMPPTLITRSVDEVRRIVLSDGEGAGASNRIPGEGEFRSNLAMGGSAEKTALTEREVEICEAMGPDLKRLGLTFVGIDVIGGKYLTEINVTSPTGIVAISEFDGTDLAGMIWDAIEGRIA